MGFSSKFKKHINLETFDAAKAAEKLAQTGGLPIRPGEYGLIIEACEDKKSASGGEYRQIDFKILAPTEINRTIKFQRFAFDCGNDSVEQRAIEQLMAIWVACGGSADEPPEAGDMVGKKFIGITGLEFNEYQGKVSYNPVITGVELDRKKKPEGPYPDEKLPAIWEEACEFYKNGGGRKGTKRAPKQKSFDNSDVPF